MPKTTTTFPALTATQTDALALALGIGLQGRDLFAMTVPQRRIVLRWALAYAAGQESSAEQLDRELAKGDEEIEEY